MKREAERTEIRNMFYALIGIVAVCVLLGIPTSIIGFIVGLFESMIIGALTSLVIGSLVEAFTGDTLKKIMLNVEIGDEYGFSISVFAVAVIVLKLFIFR
jgi:hypothetical protein